MLKSMPKKPNNTILWVAFGVLMLAGVVTLVFAFSGGNDGLDDVALAQTSAVETLAVQQLTLQAASPTLTPTVVTMTPSLTPTLSITNTVPVSPTISSGTGGSTAVGCDDSVFVADVTIPDGTEMTPGQVFKKTWTIQNNGTCAWTTAYKVTFLSGNQMNGVPDPITVEVPPGQSTNVSVSMTASATGGNTGYWILTNANGQQFGTNFYVQINVSGAASTETPPPVAATATP